MSTTRRLLSSTPFLTIVVAYAGFVDMFLFTVLIPIPPNMLEERLSLREEKDIQHAVSILLLIYGAAWFVCSSLSSLLVDLVSHLRFGVPKAMTLDEIDELVELFKHAARVAHQAEFDGVKLHGAHGFLLSQFLSLYTNRRTDEYGGSPENRMRLVRRLVKEIERTIRHHSAYLSS